MSDLPTRSFAFLSCRQNLIYGTSEISSKHDLVKEQTLTAVSFKNKMEFWISSSSVVSYLRGKRSGLWLLLLGILAACMFKYTSVKTGECAGSKAFVGAPA